MAGLCAAAHARALGAAPVVYEKGTRAGGSMLLSSCVIWRFREWDDYRAECPSGDEQLQGEAAQIVAEAEEMGIVDNVVDAANTRAVFVWGPERVRIEYVEHKPEFALT